MLDRHWLPHADLPASCHTPSAQAAILDTLRLMHTRDKLSWDLIGQIAEYAAREWVPKGLIGSPTALRELTVKKDRKVWEAIQAQLERSRNGRGADVIDAILGKEKP